MPETKDEKQVPQVESVAEEMDGKTPTERAFELARKTRLIHKQSDRSHLSMKERIEKRNKVLSKLPDHQDLFKTGEKIQKGY